MQYLTVFNHSNLMQTDCAVIYCFIYTTSTVINIYSTSIL